MSRLDGYISAHIRSQIEQRFYASVNMQSRFELLMHATDFLKDGELDVGLYSDHGVVHARDVARQVLAVLAVVDGVLIERRTPSRLALMAGYGVLLAYFHDIGMSDFSSYGRTMHPEFAAQALFDPALDDIVHAIWQENSANVAWHLLRLANEGSLAQDPLQVLREMLALSFAHSKSKVPMRALNDPAQLRILAQEVIGTELQTLYQLQQARATGKPETAVPHVNPHIQRHYANFAAESFRWLVAPQPALRSLTQDIIDTVRVLRCADALRQRGTVLKTSGGYEIFVDQQTGSALYALRDGSERLFLLELPDPISAGEANIASSELDAQGNLRIAFERGAFATPAVTARAAYNAALVVQDMEQDIIASFERGEETAVPGLKTARDMRILLEETDDNLDFAADVRAQLKDLDPALARRVCVVPSLQAASNQERDRYLAAPALAWNLEERQALLKRISQAGHRTSKIDPELAFDHVRLVSLRPNELLIEAGTPSAFVYIPLGPGLRILPLGGYDAFSVQPWMPLGSTGVIRGAVRNASVIADQVVQLLIIPKSIFLRHWHKTHSPETLHQAVREIQV